MLSVRSHCYCSPNLSYKHNANCCHLAVTDGHLYVSETKECNSDYWNRIVAMPSMQMRYRHLRVHSICTLAFSYRVLCHISGVTWKRKQWTGIATTKKRQHARSAHSHPHTQILNGHFQAHPAPISSSTAKRSHEPATHRPPCNLPICTCNT